MNVNNKSIFGFCIQDYQKTYIVSIKYVSDKNHTSEFLCEVVMEGIENIEKKFEFTILALVSDNAENMKKLRKLCLDQKPTLITNGCAMCCPPTELIGL